MTKKVTDHRNVHNPAYVFEHIQIGPHVFQNHEINPIKS